MVHLANKLKLKRTLKSDGRPLEEIALMMQWYADECLDTTDYLLLTRKLPKIWKKPRLALIAKDKNPE